MKLHRLTFVSQMKTENVNKEECCTLQRCKNVIESVGKGPVKPPELIEGMQPWWHIRKTKKCLKPS